MSKLDLTRRSFLGLSGLTAGLGLAACSSNEGQGADAAPAADGAKAADLVIKNATVQTMVAEDDVAEAVAVSGNEIVFVGTNADVEQYVGDGTRVIDLEGGFVSPGFADGHLHAPGTSIDEMFNCILTEYTTNEEYIEALKKHVEENPDSIDFELFILTPAKSFSQAPYNAEETISSTSVDESGKETTREVQVQHLQNAYHYGLLADGAAAFVNQREKEKEEPESKAFALTKSGGEKAMNDVLGCSDEFVIHHSLSAIDPTGKDVTRQNMVTTTLKSWSVHDFGSNQDFYYVDEKVEARMGGQNSDYNKTLYWGPYTEKWKPSKPFVYDGQQYNYYYGSWLNRIKHSLDLTGAGTVTVEASVPSTDNSSESKTIAVGTSDSQSSTEGWNIGFSGGGDSSGKLSGSFSFGYSSSTTTSHSNSFTMTHGSTNKALKLARNTRGTEVTFDYSEGVKPDWSWKPFQIVHMAPDILTNDCEVNNMVCWRVKNPSDSYKLKISTRHETSSMCVFYVFEGFSNNTGSWSGYNMTWSDTYTLKQPCRYLGSWNCDIAITGKNHVANASELFRKYLQGVIVEAAFKHQFNVAEMEQGELDVMKNLMRNVSLAMSQPEAKRKMIENYAKELGIESYIITWFSNDPTVEEKFTLSRAIE